MRVFAYERVSKRDQIDGYSLDSQERAIRAHCQAQGWDEPVFYADAGRSGYTDDTDKRPEFARMLRDATAGGCDVVVVHKLDRFARSIQTTLRELKRLQAADVGFVSISEQMDFSTPIGRVFLAMLAALAEYYSDNLSTEAKKGLRERALQGFPSPSKPYGAMLTEDKKGWLVDPERAPDLARILALAATTSYEAAAAALNAEGVPSRRGGPWWDGSVRRLVQAASWLAHQPPPWPERYLAAQARLAPPPVRAGRAVRMLTGLMHCGHCGGVITYNPHRTKGTVNLRCNRRPRGAHGCLPDGPRKAGAQHYEALVASWVASLPPVVALQRAAQRLAGQADPAHAARAAIEESRRKLKLQHDAGIIGDDELIAEASTLDARERALPALPRTDRDLRHAIAAIVSFPDLAPEFQRASLALLLTEAVITGREVVCVPSQPLAALLEEASRVREVAA